VTPTGQKIAQRILNDREVVFYAPLDISFAVERFLREISPKVLIIMETEIWPNLIRLAKKRGCCVVVANGRISESSFRGYRRLGPFLRPIVQMVDLFCMQTDESEERIKTLGAPAAQVKRTGNIKFDISADWKESSGVAHFKKLLGDSLLLVAGSTHENEEEMLIAIYKSLHKDFKELRLLIAPRHVERVAKIRHSVRLAGFETSYFSTLKSFGSAQVVLLDTIGDLNALYRFCAIAFVGGSLVKKGGHNLIEPALFGKPIIFGKHMDNFAEIRDLFIKEKSAIEVDSPEKLEYELRRLIANSDERRALGARSRELLEKHKGAAVRTFAEIKKVAA
jgi:3-deoxy-D-manno-octulosonic-acid transferase